MNKLAITWVNTVVQKKQPKIFVGDLLVSGSGEEEIRFSSWNDFNKHVEELNQSLFNAYNHTVGLKRSDFIFLAFVKPLFEIEEFDKALVRVSRNANRNWTLANKQMSKEEILDEKNKIENFLWELLKH